MVTLYCVLAGMVSLLLFFSFITPVLSLQNEDRQKVHNYHISATNAGSTYLPSNNR